MIYTLYDLEQALIKYLTFMEGSQNLPVWEDVHLPPTHQVLSLMNFLLCWFEKSNLNAHTPTPTYTE